MSGIISRAGSKSGIIGQTVLSNRSFCNVRLSGAAAMPGGGSGKIPFDTEQWDSGQFASEKFTVAETGYYYIELQITFAYMPGDKEIRARIFIDGSEKSYSRNWQASTGHLSANCATLWYLAKDSYVEGYAFNGDGASNRNLTADWDTYLLIHQLW